jgi:hypothetical protein
MLRHTTDEFDAFRRDRKRARARLGPQPSVLGYENAALRELEQVEEREVREQQLSREVHDFFAEATKQAASIVEKVAQDAEQEVDVRLQDEMRSFLVDAMARMNTFVSSTIDREACAGVAETQVEPDIKHLVGPELDGFRYEGSPSGRDAHIGQDPFQTAVEDVQAEFRERVQGRDEHGQEQLAGGVQELPAAAPEPTDEPDTCVDEPDAAPSAEQAAQDQQEASSPESDAEAPAADPELEQFKNALKALVRQGVMQREEAEAAWQARVGRRALD